MSLFKCQAPANEAFVKCFPIKVRNRSVSSVISDKQKCLMLRRVTYSYWELWFPLHPERHLPACLSAF